jgi:hypothetical protein
MAKEDFCFTYYDGDALRDMSHMNRLERGAYNDLVLQIRKFGHITVEQIKKCLGKDFEMCWESIELVLKRDDDGKFFIDWLDSSIKKMRAHAQHQSDNGKQGGRGKKKKAKRKPKESVGFTEPNPKKTDALPLGDGDGNEDVSGLKDKKEPEKIDFKKPDIGGDEIHFPIDTPAMRDLWAAWKSSRWHNYELRYGLHGEQADLRRMEGMTFHQIQETIQQAIAGPWKNLYPDHGKQQPRKNNGKQDKVRSAADFVANHYGGKPG